MDSAGGHYYADAPWSFFPSAVLMCETTTKQHSSASRHCRRFICAPESTKSTRCGLSTRVKENSCNSLLEPNMNKS